MKPNYLSKFFLLILFLIVCMGWCLGQNNPSKIDQEDLRAIIEMLSSEQFEGRDVGNYGQIKTQEYIVERFKALQIEPYSADGYLEKFSLEIGRPLRKVETANVIGIIKGESEQSIILSAHYDHVGKNETSYYPGADDNASGIAALLELAEEFAEYEKLKYTMIFLATTAEEVGLVGSSIHVENPDFDPAKVVCSFHFDMISRCDSKQTDCNYIYCIGNDQFALLDSLVRKADELFPHCTFNYSENDSGILTRTDASNFVQKGIPSVLFFSGFHDDYHKPTDTVDKIDFEILENRVKLICEVVKLLVWGI